MKRRGIIVLCLLPVFFLSCLALAPRKDDDEAVRAAVSRRADAIVKGDKEVFLSLLAPGDEEFLLEQSRWFDYRLSDRIADFSLEIESIEVIGPAERSVTLLQSYLIGAPGEMRKVRYAQRYKRIDGSWLDAEVAWYTVLNSYGETPEGKTTVKIFADQELLRQNSKITIERPFNGWAEPGEAIKMRLRPDAAYSYVPVVAHELVHKVTLETSKNLCSWFADGAANYFGSFAAMQGNYLDGGFHGKSDYDRSIDLLGSQDQETIGEDAQWWLYGGMAGIVVKYIADRFGPEMPRALVRALSAYPQVEGGYVYAAHDAACRDYLAAAIRSILGTEMDEFDAGWRAWISKYPG